jgi:crotonobetainyl-CoA:carnitine CoA-transferase CaiB-like acyl-CoA transferase
MDALAGIRIVEITTAWAGPFAGRSLAFFGADVIRIEAAVRPDSWRHPKITFNRNRYPDREPGERPYNRSSLFNSQNTNKRSMTLDLKHPAGKQALLDLVRESDAVITNFTPGTLGRLKLGYADLCKVKRDIIVVEMPAFGNDGPLADNTALGPTMEMVAGMAAMIGYPGGPPTVTGPAYLDPTGGLHGAAAVLTALMHRDATGEGQHVEMPQCEAAMHLIGDELLAAIASGVDPVPNGNRVSWAAPHDTFPAEGADVWVAIAVTNDAQWAALCDVIGVPGLAGDPRFATLPERLRNQDALQEPIAAWTRTRSKHEAAGALQEAGVPAAAVHNAKDALASPYLHARGFYTELDHPEAGRHLYPSLPFHLGETPGAQLRAAPCLGADTHDILRGVLGMSDEAIAALDAAGTISSVPVG